jgi:hypothetical protein
LEGVSDGSTSASLSEQLVARIQVIAASGTSEYPCFPTQNDSGSSQCLVTTATIADSSPPSTEIGILLQQSVDNVEAWQKFLRKIQLPDAELLQGLNSVSRRGGSVAGNLVWLFQSLISTYSRTRELVQVG